MDAEMGERVLRQAFELFLEPEIKRRQEAGSLPKPFSLWAAQVLMEPGKPVVIRFNSELKGVYQVKLPDGGTPPEKGAALQLADLGDIMGMQLTEDDGNAGHLTAIFHHQAWHLIFDFRYNAARIAHNLEVAQQFLEAAEGALQKRHKNAAVENLYTCVELTAKSYLMIHPDERLLRKMRHGFVATEFNRYGGKLANVEASFVRLFNALTSVRTKARYPDERLPIPEDQISKWLADARSMLADLDARRAKLYSQETPKLPEPETNA
jgi:HEPN domain-containing protein